MSSIFDIEREPISRYPKSAPEMPCIEVDKVLLHSSSIFLSKPGQTAFQRNLVFFVETDIDKRAFLSVDSVLLSGSF